MLLRFGGGAGIGVDRTTELRRVWGGEERPRSGGGSRGGGGRWRSLRPLRRAGADLILTHHAKEATEWLSPLKMAIHEDLGFNPPSEGENSMGLSVGQAVQAWHRFLPLAVTLVAAACGGPSTQTRVASHPSPRRLLLPRPQPRGNGSPSLASGTETPRST